MCRLLFRSLFATLLLFNHLAYTKCMLLGRVQNVSGGKGALDIHSCPDCEVKCVGINIFRNLKITLYSHINPVSHLKWAVGGKYVYMYIVVLSVSVHYQH